MPNLVPSDVHVQVPLTQIMIAYAQQSKDFIADKVFPVIPVEHQSDFYYKFGRRAQFDVAGSQPIEVFRAAMLRFKRRTGMRPNIAVFSTNAYNALLDHPEIIERIKYTQAGFLTEELIARALGIDQVLVASAVQATNFDEEIVADVAPTTQWITGSSGSADANGILLVYSAPRPSRNIPSAGYTFAWNGYLGASAWGGRIKKFRMEHLATDRIEIEAAYTCQITAPELGTFLSGCVANPIS
jgi:hypothetical protein